jgi:murein DD-endopeptidase MepM/ murein hydrolase activator NlpD
MPGRARSAARLLAALLAAAALATSAAPAEAAASKYWPVAGPVSRAFDPPDQPWLAGHRGIDIAASAGSTVVAAASGYVSWVGTIDYVPMLTVTHPDGLRTTYQPVRATVVTGDAVVAGQPIGTLQSGHGTTTSLHLGLLRGDQYLDPLAWLTATAPVGVVRLLPHDAVPDPNASLGGGASVRLVNGWPAYGPITSYFGWRSDPFTGQSSYHSGMDIGVACGTPVGAARAGTVTFSGTGAVYGEYVVIAHADGLTTLYGHLSVRYAAVGQRVEQGQVIGLSGTTGRSTGCHLHWGATRNGTAIDPLTLA